MTDLPKPICIVPEHTSDEVVASIEQAGYTVVRSDEPQHFKVISGIGLGADPSILDEALRIILVVSGDGSKVAFGNFMIKHLREAIKP